ncbi:uncharacterized protein VTP21DRAFT_8050 [Calcarisporiella thermophila]|uniref:uncharacterized protein n=1 Tax=Calcarisporiella thermophila TaxID=911321 RepID=UPI0037442674
MNILPYTSRVNMRPFYRSLLIGPPSSPLYLRAQSRVNIAGIQTLYNPSARVVSRYHLLHSSARSRLTTIPNELRILRAAEKDASTTAKSINEPVKKLETIQAAKPKKPIMQRIKDELIHYWHGTKLLGLEIKISTKLVYKLLKGVKLTRREQRQLRRTVSDLFRLVPFLVFIIVPFMEFLLPVALKLFPQMLPSTFESKFQEEERRRKMLKVRLEMAKFLQETIVESGVPGKHEIAAKEWADLFRKVRSTGEMASTDEIVRIAKTFEDELTLDNLSRPQLVSMCRYMGIRAFGTDNFLRYQIRNKLQQIKADDKLIMAEGVDSLTTSELISACQQRGIRTIGVSPVRMRSELAQWLDLSLNYKVPSTLILLSRAFALTEVGVTAEEALQAALSSLPDNLVNEAELHAMEREGVADFKQKLEVLEQQEELIADEAAQEEKEKRAAEEARREKEEMEEKEKKEEAAETPKEERKEALEKKIEVEKELLTDAEAEKLAKKQAVESHKIEEKDITKKEGAEEVEEKLPSDLLVQLREALAILSSKSAVLEEREILSHLKEQHEDFKEDIEEIRAKIQTGEIEPPASAMRLGKRLDKMLQKLDRELERYDTEIGERMHMIELLPTGQITTRDLEEALRVIRNAPRDHEEVQRIIKRLDIDNDGLVFLSHIVQLAEQAAHEGTGVLIDKEAEEAKRKEAAEKRKKDLEAEKKKDLESERQEA